MFPSPGRSLALLVIPALWLIGLLAGDQPIALSPLNAALLLLMVMVLVSLYATYDIGVSLPKICGVVLGVAVYFAILRYSRRASGWWWSTLLFLGFSAGVAGIGFLGTRWFTSKIALLSGLTSRLPVLVSGLPGAEEGFHPNEVAGSLLWGLPLLWAIAAALIFWGKPEVLFEPRRLGSAIRWLAGILALAVSGVMLLAQSRGSYLAIGITVGLSYLLLVPKRVRILSLAVIGVMTLAVIGLVAAGRLPDLIPAGMNASLAADPGLSLNSLQGRVEVWSRAIYGITDFPFTGMGMNTFRKVVQVLYPLFLTDPSVDIGHAHNEFLQAALDLGIPGLIAFISLYLGAFAMLWLSWKRIVQDAGAATAFIIPGRFSPSPGFMKAVIFGLGAGLFAHLLYGMTDAVALGAKPGILFWMLLGLISGLFLRLKPHPSGNPA